MVCVLASLKHGSDLQFALGTQPIVDVVSILTATGEIEFVGKACNVSDADDRWRRHSR
jgi:hypothetical protein